jgi:cysteine-rich repeat protein
MRRASSLVCFTLLAACGGSTPTPGDDAGVDGASSGCTTDSCGTGMVCVAGACAASRCGDGVIDARRGEDCEDGNTTAFDGCSECMFDCDSDGECDNGDPCNGSERCTNHACTAGTPAALDSTCTSTRVTDGVCRDVAAIRTCVGAACGNSFVDAGEDCDDGADGDPDDGCQDDCTFTCVDADDCIDTDPCNGTESCSGDHTCAAGTPIPMLGWWADCDGDGAAPVGAVMMLACVEPPSALTGCSGRWTMNNPAVTSDCLDTDPASYRGATEICDRHDNDCSSGGGVDAAEDMDSDGRAPIGAACEGGPLPETDCDDTSARVPTTETCNRGIDDDCDGMIDEDCACSWFSVAACNTGMTIQNFCGASRYIGRLERCDGTTVGLPNSYLSMYNTSMCSSASCTPTGVSYRRVECCNRMTFDPP